MPKERPPTDPAVHVHVDNPTEAKRRNGNGITVAALATVVGLIVGGVGFFATYVFVTKPELAAHAHAKSEAVHVLEKDQAVTDAAVKELAADVRDVKLAQRVTNKNLNKLLRRSRITPASREDMRIEIEGEDL